VTEHNQRSVQACNTGVWNLPVTFVRYCIFRLAKRFV